LQLAPLSINNNGESLSDLDQQLHSLFHDSDEQQKLIERGGTRRHRELERERERIEKKKETKDKEETQKNERKVETVAQSLVSSITRPSPSTLLPTTAMSGKSFFFPRLLI
jgi:hypothetical protein